MRNHILFSSNKFDQSSEVGNPQTDYGEDLAVYLNKKLTNQNIVTDPKPIQEDWGWMVLFVYQEKNYELGLGSYQDEGIENGWLCFVKAKSIGFLNRLFGKKAEIDLAVLELINKILQEDEEIGDIRWYTEEDWMNGTIESYKNRPNE